MFKNRHINLKRKNPKKPPNLPKIKRFLDSPISGSTGVSKRTVKILPRKSKAFNNQTT